MTQHRTVPLILALGLAACSGTPVGRPPPLSPPAANPEARAIATPDLPPPPPPSGVLRASTSGSLWAETPTPLLGARRASARGDILTVVIDIADSAQISNRTARSRQSAQQAGAEALFGLGGAALSPGVDVGSGSTFSGDGSVRRSERVLLRVAATVTEVMPNGTLAIAGSQEVRVNNELRELLVTGYVRPADISRLNEVSYDRIAQARISYGGRGQITDMQQPRWGAQILDAALPF